MLNRFDVTGHIYILLTLLFTVYGQLVLKWQLGGAGIVPAGQIDKLLFLLKLFLNPWIISGFASAFLASLAWIAAMIRFELNYAYPFMSLAFIIVMVFSVFFLHEQLTIPRIAGTIIVVTGLFVMTR
jgi:drug/metabolite transporter (DMT)-like permease